MSTILIQFGNPGDWGDFAMLATWQDSAGYRHRDTYGAADMPAGHAPALAGVVAAIVGLAEPWQATQVWARLRREWVWPEPEVEAEDADGPPPEPYVVEWVELTVEARNPQGGRRSFTSADYPAFRLDDPAAIAFFKHFTHHE